MSERPGSLQRIISGGQTGVDRAALDVAIELGIACGGWCPAGRWAEDGPIPDRYPLRETRSAHPAERTRRNVQEADATLIIAIRPLAGGTRLTEKVARDSGRDLLIADPYDAESGTQIAAWLDERVIHVLNVAGPRESQCAGIGERARRLLLDVLAPPGDPV